jgi:hypothetical protein
MKFVCFRGEDCLFVSWQKLFRVFSRAKPLLERESQDFPYKKVGYWAFSPGEEFKKERNDVKVRATWFSKL